MFGFALRCLSFVGLNPPPSARSFLFIVRRLLSEELGVLRLSLRRGLPQQMCRL